jgi:hypothetical protein
MKYAIETVDYGYLGEEITPTTFSFTLALERAKLFDSLQDAIRYYGSSSLKSVEMPVKFIEYDIEGDRYRVAGRQQYSVE